jgi:hypothetical protein
MGHMFSRSFKLSDSLLHLKGQRNAEASDMNAGVTGSNLDLGSDNRQLGQ